MKAPLFRAGAFCLYQAAIREVATRGGCVQNPGMTSGFRILLVAITLVLTLHRAPGSEGPNILMIAVDDLRPMLGCYGDSRAITPNIDKLAESGMVFDRAYCNYAKCGPSRASLLSGVHPENVGIYSHKDTEIERFRKERPDVVALPEWFKTHGYEARSFGKIDHDGWADPGQWSAPPFAGREKEMLEIVDPKNPDGPSVIAERLACPVMQSPDVEDNRLFGGRMTDEVVRLLSSRSAGKPFFYAVGFRRPHLPFVAPKKYYDMHHPDESWLCENPEPPAGVPPLAWFNSDGYGGSARNVGLTMPPNPTRKEAIAWNGYEMRSYLDVPYYGEISPSRQMELIQAYSACITYVDTQIGRLLEAIEAEGLRKNTVVMLWADHGWHLGEASAWGKMTNYEIATRVPFIVSAPGKPTGRTRSLAALLDIYPTLCDLAGLEKPTHLDGKSLVPILDNPEATVQDSIRHEYVRYGGRYTGKAIRSDRYRFVQWKSKKGEIQFEELYDLQGDPLETKNIVDALEGEAARLRAMLSK